MANFWDDPEMMERLGALGMGLLQGSGPSTDPANQSFGAALGKGGMSMLAMAQQQRENKRANRAISVQEQQVEMQRQKMLAEAEAMRQAAEANRQWQGQITGAPEGTRAQVGPPGNLVSLQDTLPAIPQNPMFKNLPPAFQMALAAAGREKGAGMLSEATQLSDPKDYVGPGGRVPLQFDKLGRAFAPSGAPVDLAGYKPYTAPKWLQGVAGAGSKMVADTFVDPENPTNRFALPPREQGAGVNVAVGDKARFVGDEKFIDQFAKAHETFRGLDMAYDQVNRIKELFDKPQYAGKGAESKMAFQSFLGSIGLPSNTDKLATSEQARSEFKQIFVAEMGRLGARGLSTQESEKLDQALANVDKSPAAQKYIIDRISSQINTFAKDYDMMYKGMVKRFGDLSVEGYRQPRYFGTMPKF